MDKQLNLNFVQDGLDQQEMTKTAPQKIFTELIEHPSDMVDEFFIITNADATLFLTYYPTAPTAGYGVYYTTDLSRAVRFDEFLKADETAKTLLKLPFCVKRIKCFMSDS